MNANQQMHECPASRHALRRTASRQMFGSPGQNWPGWQFDCPHCGVFIVDELELNHLLGYLNADSVPGMPLTRLQAMRQRAVIAHALRRMAVSDKAPVLTDGMTLRILQEDRLPTLAEQRD